MNKKYLGIILIIALLITPLILTGCNNSSDLANGGVIDPTEKHRGDIHSIQLIFKGNVENLLDYLDSASDISNISSAWKDMWNNLKSSYQYGWQVYRMEYYTENSNGDLILVSGAVAVPVSTTGESINVPILSLQHPTQVERKYSPSSIDVLDPQLTIPSGIAYCSTGYIVVMADYPGLGVNHDPHPYCQESLAYSVIDAIRAARDSKKYWDVESKTTTWNGELYLMGYSEGGYATMAAAKELQGNHAGEFTVSGVAPMDGPYSLSDTMRKLMINATADYTDPYFLPYVLEGYQSVYSGETDVFDFDRSVLTSVPDYTPPAGSTYARELRKLLDGNHSADEITDFMKKAVPYQGPRSILTQDFKDMLQLTSGEAYDILRQNDSYANWKPAMPMRLYHNSLDDLVPVGNSDNAMTAFSGLSNVTLETFEEYAQPGSIHAGSLPIAYYKGFKWLDGYAYPARH